MLKGADTLAALEGCVPEDRLRAAIAAALEEEAVALAECHAREDIGLRIESGEVDPFVESFLREQWLRVLAFAYRMRDAHPDGPQKALAGMDALIDSVRLRSNAQERNALIGTLPGLLAMLHEWLDCVKWTGPDRDTFFNTLAERHAASIRGAVNSFNALERRMDAMERASEHCLERRAQAQRAESLAPCLQEVDGLVPGAWCEFVRNDGGKVNCKLLWVSPGGSRFIFTGRQGELLFTLDRDVLARGVLAKRVARLPEGDFANSADA